MLALARIRQYGDPVLRMKAREVEEVDDDVRRLAERMTALMHEAQGVGLAATQVGVLRRIFVFSDAGEDRVLVNPVLTKRSDKLETDDEGCLSLRDVLVPVERPAAVTIEGLDADGEPVKLDLELPVGASRPARARPSRRGAHRRSHRRRVAAGRARQAPAAAGARRALTRQIAVAATAPFGADVLERLAESREISALLTRPDAPAGRGRKPSPPPAKEAAERLGIPVLQPDELRAGLELGAPTVVAVAYGRIVPEALLEERLWLNVHPSLLPRWRGAAPVERALMAGDPETGVTIIELVKELDAGPIAAQRSFPIEPEDDAGAIYAKSASVAVELLDEVLDEPIRARTDLSPMKASPTPTRSTAATARSTSPVRRTSW